MLKKFALIPYESYMQSLGKTTNTEHNIKHPDFQTDRNTPGSILTAQQQPGGHKVYTNTNPSITQHGLIRDTLMSPPARGVHLNVDKGAAGGNNIDFLSQSVKPRAKKHIPKPKNVTWHAKQKDIREFLPAQDDGDTGLKSPKTYQAAVTNPKTITPPIRSKHSDPQTTQSRKWKETAGSVSSTPRPKKTEPAKVPKRRSAHAGDTETVEIRTKSGRISKPRRDRNHLYWMS